MLLSACDITIPKLASTTSADSILIERYDRVETRYLTTGDFAALQEMNTKYPTQTRALIEDVLKLGTVYEPDINKRLLEFYQDSTLQNVIYAAQSQYADMSDITEGLRKAFTKLQHEIPELEIPKFYTQIGAFDQSIVVDNTSIGISLDKYLGKEFPSYLRFYDDQQRKSMSREYIVYDCVVFYLISQFPLQGFDALSQHQRDLHLGKFFWSANVITGKKLFVNEATHHVDVFMKEHKELSIKDLMKMNDSNPPL